MLRSLQGKARRRWRGAAALASLTPCRLPSLPSVVQAGRTRQLAAAAAGKAWRWCREVPRRRVGHEQLQQPLPRLPLPHPLHLLPRLQQPLPRLPLPHPLHLPLALPLLRPLDRLGAGVVPLPQPNHWGIGQKRRRRTSSLWRNPSLGHGRVVPRGLPVGTGARTAVVWSHQRGGSAAGHSEGSTLSATINVQRGLACAAALRWEECSLRGWPSAPPPPPRCRPSPHLLPLGGARDLVRTEQSWALC